jgi:hypothetical protein
MSPQSSSILNAVIQGLGLPAVIYAGAWACGLDITSGKTWTYGATCMLGGLFMGALDRHLRRQPE